MGCYASVSEGSGDSLYRHRSSMESFYRAVSVDKWHRDESGCLHLSYRAHGPPFTKEDDWRRETIGAKPLFLLQF